MIDCPHARSHDEPPTFGQNPLFGLFSFSAFMLLGTALSLTKTDCNSPKKELA